VAAANSSGILVSRVHSFGRGFWRVGASALRAAATGLTTACDTAKLGLQAAAETCSSCTTCSRDGKAGAAAGTAAIAIAAAGHIIAHHCMCHVCVTEQDAELIVRQQASNQTPRFNKFSTNTLPALPLCSCPLPLCNILHNNSECIALARTPSAITITAPS
jgi:hypothetical protein